jgi:uncharacterized ferritin-like protein (DUF455 family)
MSVTIPAPSVFQPDWAPFQTVSARTHADKPRSIQTPEGIADRLRAVAFAEIQAREAFLWASRTFEDAPASLRHTWVRLAAAENKHMNWLLDRLATLGFRADERKVSDYLWDSFMRCRSAEEFAVYMANAEERGRVAGERFYEALRPHDPVSAEIFRKIAEEEVAHIALAHKYYPDATGLLPFRKRTETLTIEKELETLETQ